METLAAIAVPTDQVRLNKQRMAHRQRAIPANRKPMPTTPFRAMEVEWPKAGDVLGAFDASSSRHRNAWTR